MLAVGAGQCQQAADDEAQNNAQHRDDAGKGHAAQQVEHHALLGEDGKACSKCFHVKQPP